MTADAGGRLTSVDDLDSLDFSRSGGLVTVVTQDVDSGRVLMVAHADRIALEHTLRMGEMHYHSRSRGLWRKGGTSGNVQAVVALVADCDGDAVLALVRPAGPACHTGTTSCFPAGDVARAGVAGLDVTVAQRAQSADAGSYTRRLLDDRNLRLKKLGEECAELVAACADGDRTRAVEETADLVYHALVALRSLGAGWSDVDAALTSRADARNDR